MHEFGLCEGVVDAVRQRAGGRQVTGVRVRFGVRHAVDEESLVQAFGMISEGTEAAGAAVELVTVPATIDCPDCGYTGETTDLLATCPRCASTDARISGGDEMTLESITYAAPPVARAASGGRAGLGLADTMVLVPVRHLVRMGSVVRAWRPSDLAGDRAATGERGVVTARAIRTPRSPVGFGYTRDTRDGRGVPCDPRDGRALREASRAGPAVGIG